MVTMKRKTAVILALVFPMAVLVGVFASFSSAFAISWDGSSAGGGGGGSAANSNGYSIRFTGDNCIGYRFSCVDKDGNNKVTKVIDVFRDTEYGNYEYTNGYKFDTKYNKAKTSERGTKASSDDRPSVRKKLADIHAEQAAHSGSETVRQTAKKVKNAAR